MKLVELKSKYPAFFSKENRRLFGDKGYRIYKDYLIVKLSKTINNSKFEGFSIYKITNEGLQYLKFIKDNYKSYIDNLKGAQ